MRKLVKITPKTYDVIYIKKNIGAKAFQLTGDYFRKILKFGELLLALRKRDAVIIAVNKGKANEIRLKSGKSINKTVL